jgi:drug/metabolite transporter (DMT)-like permease
MILQAIGLALAAAVLHATWNVRLKTVGDPLRAAMKAMVASTLCVAPLGAFAWLLAGRPGLSPHAWFLVACSSLGELAYFNFLSAAYRRGNISVVYPVARGTGPVLAVLAGLALGERLSIAGYAGIAFVLAGLWVVQRPSAVGTATGFALLTGVMIAGYTAVNSLGVHAAPSWLYAWAVWTVTAALLLLWVTFAPPARLAPGMESDVPGSMDAMRADWPQAFLMGALMSVTYFLVLTALSIAPLLVVAPVRESAIVLVTVWSVLRMGERQAAGQRVAGAVAVVCGIALLVA